MIIGRPISAPWGLDESFDAFFLYGHHSMGNTERGVLCHSWSSRAIANCWLNGELIGEIGFNAAVAGSFGIPTVFISGDDTAIAETQQYVPNIVSVMTKKGLSQTSALSLSPAKARELLQVGGKGQRWRKLGKLSRLLLIRLTNLSQSCWRKKRLMRRAKRADVERLDSHRHKIVGDTLIEIAHRR